VIFFRFVYLEDCSHSIESKALTKWIEQNNFEIHLKLCPLCQTSILKTQRFMNQTKIIMADLSKIKEKNYGKPADLRRHTINTMNSLKITNDQFPELYIGDKDKTYKNIKHLWDKWCNPLLRLWNSPNSKRSKFYLQLNDIQTFNFVIDLFKNIASFKNRIKAIGRGLRMETIVNHFVWLLSVVFNNAKQLSKQQKIDISMQMARGARIVSLFEIMSNPKVQLEITMNADTNEVKIIIDQMEALLMSWKRYTISLDEEIQHLTLQIQQKINELPEFLSNEELQMIPGAMSSSFVEGTRAQGHWCKCVNGDIYCITE